jgi:hypothetical protein
MRLAAAASVIAALAVSVSARAADLPCGPVEKGTIRVDGLTEDWNEVDGLDGGGRDSNLSFTIKCNVDDRALYLLIDVRDNYFVRTKAAKPGEDHLVLTFAGHKLSVFPGDNAALPSKLAWGTKPAKGISAASALQPRGWAVELALPLGAVPGFRAGQPSLPFAIEAFDCDSKAALKTERSVELAGRIAFAEGESALDEFLKDRSLRRADIFWEHPIAFGRTSGAQVVLAGKYMAVISDGYFFQELPVRDRRDLKDERVVDLAGDGRQALVLRYVERGSGGAREVLAAYRFGDSQATRVFAMEIGKSAGASKIEDRVTFVKRGRATDILVEAQPAVGWTQATYKEAPADDVIPVLLPWADERRARYTFHGDEYQRAQ